MPILGIMFFVNKSQWYYNGLLNFTQCIVSLYVTPVIRSSDSDIECVISSHDCAFFIAWNNKKWAEKIHLALFLAASFILGHYDNSLREEMFREDICLIIILKHKERFQAIRYLWRIKTLLHHIFVSSFICMLKSCIAFRKMIFLINRTNLHESCFVLQVNRNFT